MVDPKTEVPGVLVSSKRWALIMLVLLASPRWRWCPGGCLLVPYGFRFCMRPANVRRRLGEASWTIMWTSSFWRSKYAFKYHVEKIWWMNPPCVSGPLNQKIWPKYLMKKLDNKIGSCVSSIINKLHRYWRHNKLCADRMKKKRERETKGDLSVLGMYPFC